MTEASGGSAGQNPAAIPDAAVKALADEIVRLSGAIHEANAARDKAIKERDQAVRDEQEFRGIVETFGRATRELLLDKDEERLVFTVNSWVLRAAGTQAPMVFIDGLKKVLHARVAGFRASGVSAGSAARGATDTSPFPTPKVEGPANGE